MASFHRSTVLCQMTELFYMYVLYMYIFNNYTMSLSRIWAHSQLSYMTRANGIIVLLPVPDKHGIFGIVLSSNSLISCSFTLAKCSAILLFFSLLIGYELEYGGAGQLEHGWAGQLVSSRVVLHVLTCANNPCQFAKLYTICWKMIEQYCYFTNPVPWC